MRDQTLLRCWALAVLLGACSSSDFRDTDGALVSDDATAPADDAMVPVTDAGTPGRDAPEPNWDAFFADDPPPKYCGPDGGGWTPPELPGGTPECPSDKNREGCSCDNRGEQAPCWPGLRVNRNRGICKDGVTVCEAAGELQYRWGPCEGYVLPTPGETKGPGVCRCFSSGRWIIDNLSPCFITYSGAAGAPTYAVSTYLDSSGNAQCPTLPSGGQPPPTPEPGKPFSTNRLNVDCTGQFKLCYTIKAGDPDKPTASDCIMAHSCTDVWYDTKDVEQELPPLPGWTASDAQCVQAFIDGGGYGEMSVVGLSSECEPVDDGSGVPLVFLRVKYCPLACAEDPTLPECENCGNGASGDF